MPEVKVMLKVSKIETTCECPDCGGQAKLTSTAVHGHTVEEIECPHCEYYEARSEDGVRLPEFYTGEHVEFESPAFFLDCCEGIGASMHGRRVG